MPKKDVYDELKIIMTDALLKMGALAQNDTTGNTDFLGAIRIFLIGIINTAAGIGETITESAAPWLYAEIETAAKNGGIDTIQKTTSSKNQYSISDIAPDDYPNAKWDFKRRQTI